MPKSEDEKRYLNIGLVGSDGNIKTNADIETRIALSTNEIIDCKVEISPFFIKGKNRLQFLSELELLIKQYHS
jgi:hypothetical protein